jgi:hypothetical protein
MDCDLLFPVVSAHYGGVGGLPSIRDGLRLKYFYIYFRRKIVGGLPSIRDGLRLIEASPLNGRRKSEASLQ